MTENDNCVINAKTLEDRRRRHIIKTAMREAANELSHDGFIPRNLVAGINSTEVMAVILEERGYRYEPSLETRELHHRNCEIFVSLVNEDKDAVTALWFATCQRLEATGEK